jgi:uncharacterized membrane protein YedE/YeeE
MCNASFFPSVLLAILYLLKRSDATAAETAPAASPDYVPASGAAQAAVAPIPREKQLLLFALEMVSGFLFGSGLVVAGMVNPAKVRICTLAPTSITPFQGHCILVRSSWRVCAVILLPAIATGQLGLSYCCRFDPSLAFVMGGAIAVAFPVFQYIIRREIPCENKTMYREIVALYRSL